MSIDLYTGKYEPKPVPQEEDALLIYLDEELNKIANAINNMQDGGVFPPQGQMPVRYAEGMTVFFDTEIVDEGITSTGLWRYASGEWNKIGDGEGGGSETTRAFEASLAIKLDPGEIPVETVRLNVGGFVVNNGKVVIPESGYYRVRASCLYDGGAVFLFAAKHDDIGQHPAGYTRETTPTDCIVEEILYFTKGEETCPYRTENSNYGWSGYHSSYSIAKIGN